MSINSIRSILFTAQWISMAEVRLIDNSIDCVIDTLDLTASCALDTGWSSVVQSWTWDSTLQNSFKLKYSWTCNSWYHHYNHVIFGTLLLSSSSKMTIHPFHIYSISKFRCTLVLRCVLLRFYHRSYGSHVDNLLIPFRVDSSRASRWW